MNWNEIIFHTLTVLPATLAAVASLIAVARAKRESKKDMIVIHDLVNSNLQKVKDSLEAALAEIQRLRG